VLMKKILITSLLICLLPVALFAQHSDESGSQKLLKMYEDSLSNIGKQVVNDTEEMDRKNANYHFIKTLVSALKIPNSFLYPFDSIKTIKILNSPDNRFRIITWFVANDDGSYRFYGAVQMNTGGRLKLYPLNDYSPLMQTPQDSVGDNTKWYGAQYYDIIRVSAEKQYYVLLGWKGYTDKATKKVIEVLSFNKNDQPVFGAAVFDGSKSKKRIIFEYTRQASMLLHYLPDQDMIVFDHLSPPQEKLKNDPSSYGPDLSYDGLKLVNGKWKLIENMDMRNKPDVKTDGIIDPKKQAIKDMSQYNYNN
jgi:hypothetical protein